MRVRNRTRVKNHEAYNAAIDLQNAAYSRDILGCAPPAHVFPYSLRSLVSILAS
jgi:hypothetical protein